MIGVCMNKKLVKEFFIITFAIMVVFWGVGNIVIDLPMMTIITYIFMMVIALICAKKTYSKHQVE